MQSFLPASPVGKDFLYFSDAMLQIYSKTNLQKLYRDFVRLSGSDLRDDNRSNSNNSHQIIGKLWYHHLFVPYTSVQDYFRIECLRDNKTVFVLRCRQHMLLWDIMRLSMTATSCRLCLLHGCELRLVSWEDSPFGCLNLGVSAVIDLHSMEVMLLNDHAVSATCAPGSFRMRVHNGPEIQDIHFGDMIHDKYPKSVKFFSSCSLRALVASHPDAFHIQKSLKYLDPRENSQKKNLFIVMYYSFEFEKLQKRCINSKTTNYLSKHDVIYNTAFRRWEAFERISRRGSMCPWQPTANNAILFGARHIPCDVNRRLGRFFLLRLRAPARNAYGIEHVQEMAIASITEVNLPIGCYFNMCYARQEEMNRLRKWLRILTFMNPEIAWQPLADEYKTTSIGRLIHFFAKFQGLRYMVAVNVVLSYVTGGSFLNDSLYQNKI